MRFLVISALIGGAALCGCGAHSEAEAHNAPLVDRGVTITLERMGCFGTCPAYKVRIDGDGNVTYKGASFVAEVGERHGKVSREDVAALLRAFEAAGFESLHDDYSVAATDLPSHIVTLTRNGRTKIVRDYGGIMVGMPKTVEDIELQIDRVANTRQWVVGNGAR